MRPLRLALESALRKAGVRHFRILTLLAPMVIIGMMIGSALQVLADDSLARFGAGGIELLESKDIRMLEEVLHISTTTVRVRFRFLNESDKNIDTSRTDSSLLVAQPVYLLYHSHGPGVR